MKIEFAEFLISALIAAESLLVAVFGSLYTVYGAYMTTTPAPICVSLRWLCGLLSGIVCLTAVLAVYTNHQIWAASSDVPAAIFFCLDLIVVLIPVPALVITWRMMKDGSP